MPIRAVIFDMGGVILRTEKHEGRRKWETRLGLKEGELPRLVFESKASELASIGQQSEDDLWKHIQGALNLSDEQMREFVPDFWAGDEVDHELLEFIRELRPRYKTAILSNAYSTGRWAITEKFGLRDAVDELIISAEEGVAKPDARLYRIAAARLNVQPAEVVFVDDVLANVEGARAVGMNGVHFRNTAQAIAEVRAVLNEAPLDSPSII
jgi:putative hydrolase of the HAD superfamily